MKTLAAFWRDRHGSGAVEFVLVLPGILFLLVGSINLFLVTYADVNLHSAADAAARYASVTTAAGGSPTQATVSAYAKTYYIGPDLGAVYTYTTPSTCGANGSSGYSVQAAGSYKVYYGFGTLPFSLGSKACYP